MITKKEIAPGVTLRCCRDSRFKQGCLSFQLVRPMKKEEAAKNALLSSVLLRGTKYHPDLRSVTAKLDTLYGASVSPLVRRIGDYQTVGFYCGFMDDRFALPGDKVLEPMLRFLEEILLDCPVENGGLRRDFVESEKRNLAATIDAELNDKRAYANNQLLRTMCRNDSFGIPRLGEKEAVLSIDAVDLYNHYQTILRESPIQVFYVGSAQPEQVEALLAPIWQRLERDPFALLPQTGFHSCPGEDVEEILEVSQGKLCLGYTTPITNRDENFPAMQVMNTIFGAGMTSKLFMNVRERLSLCYSVGSSYFGTKGIVIVSAGIDFDKEAMTRAEVHAQLEACRRGEISDAELLSAKEALLSSLRATHDSPAAIEGYYATAALSGMPLSPEAYMAAVEAVTKEQAAAAARLITPHSSYFLKGAANEAN